MKRNEIKKKVTEYNWMCCFDDCIIIEKNKLYLIFGQDDHKPTEKVIKFNKAKKYLDEMKLRITRKEASKLYKFALYYNKIDND